MRKTLFLLFTLVAATTVCNAQRIESEKTMGEYRYTLNGQRITLADMANLMQSNPEAYESIKKAQANSVGSVLLGIAGGALIGWPIGTAIGGGDPNWALAGIGAGLVIVSIPLSSSKNKHAGHAVDLYNASLGSPSSHLWKIQAGGNGVGLCLQF